MSGERPGCEQWGHGVGHIWMQVDGHGSPSPSLTFRSPGSMYPTLSTSSSAVPGSSPAASSARLPATLTSARRGESQVRPAPPVLASWMSFFSFGSWAACR